MNRRAFTLIELLVVIAIIAILASILFPVFAQAKYAAKKVTTLSNIKQVGLAIIMYATDYDDIYPRQDGCDPTNPLNPNLNPPVAFPPGGIGPGCTAPPFAYRTNHFKWQRWVLNYVKSVPLFFNQLRQRDETVWNTSGDLVNQFSINTGLTGQLDTYNRTPTFPRQVRTSWIGGTQTAIPRPSDAMMLMETSFTGVAHVVAATYDGPTTPVPPTVTAYPVAIREYWRYRIMKGTIADCLANTSGTELDMVKTSNGGLTVGFADGSSKFIQGRDFLGRTPTMAEFGATINFPSAGVCAFGGGNVGITNAPNTNINYPFWGFGS